MIGTTINDTTEPNGSFNFNKISVSLKMEKIVSIIDEVKNPDNWEKLLEGMKKMRCSDNVKVETKGCQEAGDLLPLKVILTSLYQSFNYYSFFFSIEVYVFFQTSRFNFSE